MKLIYIASPLAGDVEKNIDNALRYCVFAAMYEDCVPLAPHTIFTRFLDDSNPVERKKGIKMGIELLKRCDELWVFGSYISTGMKAEITIAKKHGIPVRYFDDDCEEVST